MLQPFARAVLLAACTLAAATASAADVYTWVDEQGTVHFQETPPPRRRAKKVVLPDPPPPAKPPAARAKAPPPAPPPLPVADVPRPPPAVELFTTRWCPACAKAREYLTRRGIPFTEYDVEKDSAASRRKRSLDGRNTVPVALIGGKVIVGFAPAAYERALQGR